MAMTGDEAFILSSALVTGLASGVKNVQVEGQTLKFTFQNGQTATMTFPTPQGATDEPFKDLAVTLVEVGGLPKGSDINGLTLREAFLKDLYPQIPPAITIAVNPNTRLVEKGTTVQNVTITANVKANNNTITSVSFHNGGVKLNERTTGIADGGSFSFAWNNANLTRDTQIIVKCTDGKDTVNATHNYKFVNRSYYGVVPANTVLTPDIVTGLAGNVLKDVKELDQRFQGVNCHIVYAYPAAFGAITSIKDAQNFQYQEAGNESYSRENMEINGENYYVYKLIKPVSMQTAVQQHFT